MKHEHLTKADHLQKRISRIADMLHEMFYSEYEFDPREAASLQRAMTNANGAAVALAEFITDPDIEDESQ